MTVRELEEEMDYDELVDWSAYYKHVHDLEKKAVNKSKRQGSK